MTARAKFLTFGLSVSLVLAVSSRLQCTAVSESVDRHNELARTFFARNLADVRGSWPLDEGAGNTAHDLSGNGNHGTLLNGPTWVPGISGNAVEFDGVDDLIDMNDSPSLDIRRNLSIKAWIKPHVNDRLLNIIGKWGITDGENRSYVLNIGGYPADLPHGSHPGHVCLILSPDGGTHYLLSSTGVVPANQWTHVLATYDGTTMALYINDVLDATQAVPMGDIFSGNARLQIGSTESEPTSFKFDGLIDDAQVSGDIDALPENCRGYWPLDEGGGITAYDLSGNGNHGTLLNGPRWVPGISGNAVEFDGVDDLIDMSDSYSLDIRRNLSIRAWIKPHMNDRLMDIIGKWGITGGDNRSYVLNIGGYPEGPHGSHPGRLCLVLTPDGGTHYLLSSTSIVPANQWTHVVATYDGTTMALYINDVLDATQAVPMGDIFSGNARLQLGATESEPTQFRFDGIIDEAQVSGDIDALPENCRGYWPLDEGEGITAYDLSGNGNHGTLLNGPTWVPGISGHAVEFDGEDDLIDVNDSPSLDIRRNLSIRAWIKPHMNDRLMDIIGKWGITGGDNRSYVLDIGGYPEGPHGSHPGRLCLVLTPDGGTHYLLASTDVVPTNEWTHVLATYDGTTMTLYINDVLDATQVVPMGDIFSGNARLQIGSVEGEAPDSGHLFDGVIDEAQVGGDIIVEPGPDEGDPYLRYGWVCGDRGPCTCNMPGWNPPEGALCLPPPTYYVDGFDTVDAYAGQQLAMRVMCANHVTDSPDEFCVRIFGYPPGWTFSGDPTLGSGTFLNPGYGWWQTTYINVPCTAGLDSYNRVIIQQNYYHGAPCVDASDKEVPNTRQCTSGDRCTRVMYREDTLFVHIVAAPPSLAVFQDEMTLIERGQPQAYIAFSLCNGDPCTPPTRIDYNIVSKGHVGYALNTTAYVMVPGGECRDVYGILDASFAAICTFDTLTIIAWMGAPPDVAYDTCVQLVHVIAPVAVPLFTAPAVTILVLALLLAAGFFIRKRAVGRA